MEKIYIKPTTQEIIIKGAVADGHMDIFSYEPSDEQTKKLGHLYVVGHVQHDTDDMTYSINLISALAKREYYSTVNVTPKEAFAGTLKKINEVVEEFFEHKGLKINIGVFAIAGEQMYIAKLGKFKVLLARDDKTIDVLNNAMFDREHVQEKQFSSVISGGVNEKDRILAYYPSRGISARERYLKMYLHKYDSAQFAEQLQTIKKGKEDFSCAMVYIQLDKHKEIATAPRIQPQELTAPSLTAASREQKIRPDVRKTRLAEAIAETEAPEPAPMPIAAPVVQEQPLVRPLVTSSRYVETHNEVPQIIPSEFSRGRKDSFFSSALSRFSFSHLSPKNKAVLSLSLVAIIIGATFAVQAVVGVDPETRDLNAALKTASEKLELAKIKISQDAVPEARSILNSSLASLAALSDEKAGATKNELQQLLDEIDQAQDVAPTLVTQLPSDGGRATLLGAGAKLLAYIPNEQGDKGSLSVIEGSAIKTTKQVENTRPAALVTSTKGTPVILDMANKKTVAIKDSGLEVATFSVNEPIAASYFYEDNLYLISEGTIMKVADIFNGESTAKNWMKKDVALVANPALMVVDGNIVVMGKDGTLVTYFRGEKQSEVQTSFNITDSHRLLTNNDSPSLYLFDTKSGRISVLDKKTGTLLRTLKIGSQDPIATAAMGADEAIYFVTQDNKIWKVATQ